MRNGDLYDANGRFVRKLGDDEENYIVKDGESVRVPLNMMDSVQRDVMQHALTPRQPLRAPGFVQVADSDYAERERRFFDRKERLSKAWEQAPSPAVSSEPVKPAEHRSPVTHDADAAYERRNVALERAYLGGA